MRATVSIIGLYAGNNNIFNGIGDLTASYTDKDENTYTATVSREDIIDALLYELAELEMLYTDGDFMQQSITYWWNRKKSNYEALLQTTLYNFDPIANYDRSETMTDTQTRNLSATVLVSENLTERFRAGYDNNGAPELAERDRSSGDQSSSDTGTVTNTHTARTVGNIGVTTSQQMVTAQRELVIFDLMDYIVDSFKSRFCIMVY